MSGRISDSRAIRPSLLKKSSSGPERDRGPQHHQSRQDVGTAPSPWNWCGAYSEVEASSAPMAETDHRGQAADLAASGSDQVVASASAEARSPTWYAGGC